MKILYQSTVAFLNLIGKKGFYTTATLTIVLVVIQIASLYYCAHSNMYCYYSNSSFTWTLMEDILFTVM